MPNSKEQTEQVLSLQDLRAIIHGLKMSGLAFLEEDARDAVGIKISELPSPEQLISMLKSEDVLKNLTRQVGEIMRLLELYGKRDGEYKSRFKSKKGLPPRYKVLEWRKNMKTEARSLVQNLVKMSADVDNKGQGELAGKLISYAGKAKFAQDTESIVVQAATDLEAAGFYREAQGLRGWWEGLKGGLKGIGEGIATQYHVFSDPAKMMSGIARLKSFLGRIQGDVSSLNKLLLEYGNYVRQPDMKKVLQDANAKLGQIHNIVQEVSNTNLAQIEQAAAQAAKQTTVTAPAGAPAAGAGGAAGAAGAGGQQNAEQAAATNPQVAQMAQAAQASGFDVSKMDVNQLSQLMGQINKRRAELKKNPAGATAPNAVAQETTPV